MKFVQTVTEDKLILQGLLSPADSADTVILHIHGMSGNFWENTFIKTMLVEYPKNNISFLTVETRGSELHRWFSKTDGALKLIGNSYEIFEESELDLRAWITYLISQGYKKIHLQGHSLGCSKIAYYVTKNSSPEVQSLLFISPADMLGLILEPKMQEQHERLVSEATSLKHSGNGATLLSETFWGYARMSADSYINFFGSNAATAIFNFFKPELGYNVINKINKPILSILGTADDGVATDQFECTDIFKREAQNCPKFNGLVYDGASHSFEKFEAQIVADVLKFIAK